MCSRENAIAQYLLCVSYVIIQTYSGDVYEGDIVRIGNDYCVVDDIGAFGDMVVIRYSDIMDVAGR